MKFFQTGYLTISSALFTVIIVILINVGQIVTCIQIYIFHRMDCGMNWSYCVKSANWKLPKALWNLAQLFLC